MADTYRLLLDENIEHEVMERLIDAGHDVEHVDTVAKLGKGAHDTALAAYSVATERAIVTYDDDFIDAVPPTAYRAALFFEDETLPAQEIARIIDAMAELYPYKELVGLQKTGREWLKVLLVAAESGGRERRHSPGHSHSFSHRTAAIAPRRSGASLATVIRSKDAGTVVIAITDVKPITVSTREGPRNRSRRPRLMGDWGDVPSQPGPRTGTPRTTSQAACTTGA